MNINLVNVLVRLLFNVVWVDLYLLSFYFLLYNIYLICYLLLVTFFLIIICYVADKVFAPTCSTHKVYEEGAKDVALSALSGINGNLFSANACWEARKEGQRYHAFGLSISLLVWMILSLMTFCLSLPL